MKVILFIHQSSEMYGSDKVLYFLVRGLLQSGKYYPVVILPEVGPLQEALSSARVEVHIGEVAKISRAVFSPLGLLRLAGKTIKSTQSLNAVVGRRDVEIVHSNTLAVLSGAVWAFLRGKKHLWHVHEIILSPKLVSKVFPYVVRLLSDCVMSNSTLTERWLLSSQPALASRSIVVFNGLPAVQKPSENAIKAFRRGIGALDGDVVVTLAGRINRMKGQQLLISAALLLKDSKRLGAIRFVVVGSAAPGLGHLPDQLKELVNLNNLGNCFSFINFVDDIWPVWFGTDIAVVPSTEPESFGMVAIEAMAASVPVIAAGHGGLLDIVVNEETGLLFAPKDADALANAIYRLAHDSELRRELGESGAKRQHDLFSIASQVDKTIRAYEDMLK